VLEFWFWDDAYHGRLLDDVLGGGGEGDVAAGSAQ